jgi:hypothetical protein
VGGDGEAEEIQQSLDALGEVPGLGQIARYEMARKGCVWRGHERNKNI